MRTNNVPPTFASNRTTPIDRATNQDRIIVGPTRSYRQRVYRNMHETIELLMTPQLDFLFNHPFVRTVTRNYLREKHIICVAGMDQLSCLRCRYNNRYVHFLVIKRLKEDTLGKI